MTDWLLYSVSKKIPEITYTAFSRHEEARRTGADWEWWILLPTMAIKMRIQAKKLVPNGDNYPLIAHTNRYGLQIEKLLSDAQQANSLPLYAFYSRERAPTACPRGVTRTGEGVFIAGGNRIYDLLVKPGRIVLPSYGLLALAHPLSCLLCCPLISGEGYVRHSRDSDGWGKEEGWLKFLSLHFWPELRGHFDDNVPHDHDGNFERGIHRHVPSYVSDFLKRGGKIPEGWDRDFDHDLEHVNALLVYDIREGCEERRATEQEDRPPEQGRW